MVVGVLLRWWLLESSQGALDSDEAVWGLMARHLQHGEFPTFFWAQSYGGTIEVILTVPVFWVFGSSTAALRVVPISPLGHRCAARVARRSPRPRRMAGSGRSGPLLGLVAVLRLEVDAGARLLRRRARARAHCDAARAAPARAALAGSKQPRSGRGLSSASAGGRRRRPRSHGARRRVAGLRAAGDPQARGSGGRHVRAWQPSVVDLQRPAPLGVAAGRSGDATAAPEHLHNLFSSTLPTALGTRLPVDLSWFPNAPAGVAVYGMLLLGFAFLLVPAARAGSACRS